MATPAIELRQRINATPTATAPATRDSEYNVTSVVNQVSTTVPASEIQGSNGADTQSLPSEHSHPTQLDERDQTLLETRERDIVTPEDSPPPCTYCNRPPQGPAPRSSQNEPRQPVDEALLLDGPPSVWTLLEGKIPSKLSMLAVVVTIVFGIGAWVGMNYANSYARKGYQLALFGACHDYEDVKTTEFCKGVIAAGIESARGAKRGVDAPVPPYQTSHRFPPNPSFLQNNIRISVPWKPQSIAISLRVKETVLFFLGVVFIYQFGFRSPMLPSLPVVGAKDGDWMPRLQTRWRNFFNIKEALIKSEHESPGRSRILPLLGNIDIVVLPRSEIDFVRSSYSSLSSDGHALDERQIKYLCEDKRMLDDEQRSDFDIVLLQTLDSRLPDLFDEINRSIQRYWGVDADFKDICLYDTMYCIVSHVTSHALIGHTKCTNPDLLPLLCMWHAKQISRAGRILSLFWGPVKTVLATVLTIPIYTSLSKFEAMMRSEIETRIAQYEEIWDSPNRRSTSRSDFLRRSICRAKMTDDPYLWKSRTLASRVLLLSSAVIPPSCSIITNAILDLVSKQEYIDELRHEIKTNLAEVNGEWSLSALQKMYKLRSFMLESMRVHSLGTVGHARKVVAKDGIMSPSGIQIPHGTTTALPSYGVFQDSSVYPDAHEFHPFRFSPNLRFTPSSGCWDCRQRNKSLLKSMHDLTYGLQLDTYPPRNFVLVDLQLILAYVVLNYDFGIQSDRPKDRWRGVTKLLPVNARLRVRKGERLESEGRVSS